MAWDDTKIDGNVVEPTEWNDMVADIKKRLGLLFNVQSYDASPDGTTTTSGSITAATDDLSVASASTFAVDQGIVVVGASLDTNDTGNTEDTDNDFTTTGADLDNEWMARKYTATNDGAVGAVANVMLKKTGAPAGTIVATIYSDDGGGTSVPLAQIGGASAAITNTDLNASGAAETFTWATDFPVQTNGVDYWVVLKPIGYTYTDGVTEVIWQTDADGAAGLNECAKYDNNAGTPWTSMGANVGADITINLNLTTTITIISGTDVTLAANATVTVSSALVRHDEVTAFGAAHTAATASGGWMFFPAGVYNLGASVSFNSDVPLWFDPAATLAINSGVTVTILNMIPPSHTIFSGSGSIAWGVQAITAVSDTILADSVRVELNPDANYTLTSAPTIADGTIGQVVAITAPNGEANIVWLQDQDSLASSNLQLKAATRAITGKSILTLMFDGSEWIEQAYQSAGDIDTIDNSDAATSGAGEDDLQTITIEANSLGDTGGLRLTAAGTKTNANGNKTIKFYLGATSITFNAAANDVLDWRLEAILFNTAAGAQRVSWKGYNGTTLLQGYEAWTEDTTGDLVLKLTGECANASDVITQTMFIVERLN